MKRALFPGSFDPITAGHVEIVHRSLKIFDEVLVAIGINSAKKYFFSLEERLEMLRLCFAAYPQIKIASYHGLTVEYARQQEAGFLLRGLRTPQDLVYEKPIEMVNKHLTPEIEVVYLSSNPETAAISSTIVREVMKYKGSVDGLVPDEVLDFVYKTKY